MASYSASLDLAKSNDLQIDHHDICNVVTLGWFEPQIGACSPLRLRGIKRQRDVTHDPGSAPCAAGISRFVQRIADIVGSPDGTAAHPAVRGIKGVKGITNSILPKRRAEPTEIKPNIKNASSEARRSVANSITIGRHQDPFAKLRRGMRRVSSNPLHGERAIAIHPRCVRAVCSIAVQHRRARTRNSKRGYDRAVPGVKSCFAAVKCLKVSRIEPRRP